MFLVSKFYRNDKCFYGIYYFTTFSLLCWHDVTDEWYRLLIQFVMCLEFYDKKKEFNDTGIDYARMLLFVLGFLVYWKISPNSYSFLAMRVYDRRHSAFYVTGHRKVECLAGMAGNLSGGLFARSTITISVFTRVMITLPAIYYRYTSHYLILYFYAWNM